MTAALLDERRAPAARSALLADVRATPFGRGAAIALIRVQYAAGTALKTTAVADQVADDCARALAELVPPGCSLFHAGDDTFAAVARASAGSRCLRELSRQAAACFRDPLCVREGIVVVTPATGLAVVADDIMNGEQLLARARTALERAVAERQTMVEYTEKLDARIARDALIDRHLRGAVAANELDLRYQPVVSTGDGSVIGVEALLRWHSRELGVVPAHEFIAVAEASGSIEHLGEWVFRHAFAAYTSWNLPDDRRPRLMINVTPRQLTQRNFFGTITSAASAVGMDLRRLDLELTESAMTPGRIADWSDQLRQLRARGIRVTLDDFGAGHSSLSCVATMPLDLVKLDHALVRRLLDDPVAQSIAAAMIALAHARGLSVVGEGVETEEIAAKLSSMGCDALQGFLIARPLAADAAFDFIRTERAGTFVRGRMPAGAIRYA